MTRLLPVFVILAFAGCTATNAASSAARRAPTEWLQFQSNVGHNAVFPGTLSTRWERATGGKINGGLALAGGTLYAVSFDRHLYALDPATGNVRWTASASNILMSTPVVSNGLVIVGSGKDGFLKPNDAKSQVWGRPEGDDVLAYSAAGKLRWKIHTAGDDMPSGAIAGDTLFLSNGDARAYAYRLRNGTRAWSRDLPGIATMSSATLHHGVFFTSVCHNAPYYCNTIAMRQRDGTVLWSNDRGGGDCTPAIDNGRVFVQSASINTQPYTSGGSISVHALDERTGKTLWTRTYPPAPYTYVGSSERQIAATALDGVLYVPIANLARVVALDERTGREIWTVHTAGNVKMSPVFKDGYGYFGDTAGILYTIDQHDGKIVHAASYLQPFAVSPPVIDGQTLFIANGDIVVAIPLTELR